MAHDNQSIVNKVLNKLQFVKSNQIYPRAYSNVTHMSLNEVCVSMRISIKSVTFITFEARSVKAGNDAKSKF